MLSWLWVNFSSEDQVFGCLCTNCERRYVAGPVGCLLPFNIIFALKWEGGQLRDAGSIDATDYSKRMQWYIMMHYANLLTLNLLGTSIQ